MGESFLLLINWTKWCHESCALNVTGMNRKKAAVTYPMRLSQNFSSSS